MDHDAAALTTSLSNVLFRDPKSPSSSQHYVSAIYSNLDKFKYQKSLPVNFLRLVLGLAQKDDQTKIRHTLFPLQTIT
jgi:hypothetical protein